MMIYDEISTGKAKVPSLLPMEHPDQTVVDIEFGAKHKKPVTIRISMEAAVVLIADLSAHVRDHLLPKS